MNGGGGRAPALPAPRAPAPPRPRLPGGSGSRTRGPASPSRTGCSARLSRQGLGVLGPKTAAGGTSRVLGARPERPPSPRLARAQGTATDAAPAPSSPRRTPRCGQMWADVEAGRLHGGGAEGGEEIPPLPWGAGFLLREVLFTQPNKVRRRRRLPALSASKG